MSRTFRNVNPRTTAAAMTHDVHVVGDGKVRSDKEAGWALDWRKESGAARKGTIRTFRATERRALDSLRADNADPDGIIFPVSPRTEGWVTH